MMKLPWFLSDLIGFRNTWLRPAGHEIVHLIKLTVNKLPVSLK